VLARLLIRRGSILKAKLRMAKRLSKARAVISPRQLVELRFNSFRNTSRNRYDIALRGVNRLINNRDFKGPL
jgi:hypothetical protein